MSLLFLLGFTADAGFHAAGAGWKIKMDPSLDESFQEEKSVQLHPFKDKSWTQYKPGYIWSEKVNVGHSTCYSTYGFLVCNIC